MPHQHDDDLGPVGGIGTHGTYGGRQRIRKQPSETIPDWQIRNGLDSILEEAADRRLTAEQLAHRLRIYLRDEHDRFISEQEALSEVQKRQS